MLHFELNIYCYKNTTQSWKSENSEIYGYAVSNKNETTDSNDEQYSFYPYRSSVDCFSNFSCYLPYSLYIRMQEAGKYEKFGGSMLHI